MDRTSESGSQRPLSGAMETSTLQLLRRLVESAQRSGPAVAHRADLSRTEFDALELLVREPYGPGDLARHLGVTSAAASGIVDRLEARGHAERVPHASDRRRTQVVLTTSGREEIIGHLMPMFLALDELDRSLGDDEREIIDRYLAGAIDAIARIL